MKIKLRALLLVGLLLFLSPVIYVSTTVRVVASLVLGLFIIYVTWRIRAQYKITLLKLRRYEDTSMNQ